MSTQIIFWSRRLYVLHKRGLDLQKNRLSLGCFISGKNVRIGIHYSCVFCLFVFSTETQGQGLSPLRLKKKLSLNICDYLE